MPSSETVPCPLCGSEATKRFYQGDSFAIGRCLGCGLIRQNPRLTAEVLLGDYYRDWRLESGSLVARPEAYEGLDAWQSRPVGAYEAGVDFVDANRLRKGPKGKWVDVGASTGGLLVAARDAGWQVAGVEPGEAQAKLCCEVHGLDVVQGVLSDARLPDGFAEVVSYRHVLEHVHDPASELAEACRVLAPDGLLLAEVPNYDGFRYRWGRLRTALRLCRPFWRRLNVPEHLYYFTDETLALLLCKAGFAPVRSRTYGRTRLRRGPVRRLYDRVRDRFGLGNNLRVVARKETGGV